LFQKKTCPDGRQFLEDDGLRRRCRSVALILSVVVGLLIGSAASAEWYVAGQFGANFADQLSDIRGTGSLSGFRSPDFDLQNSFVYGGKVGMYPGNGWFGVELDVFHSTPHVKNLDDVPGFHMRVTNVGVNLLARYPGVTFQPYAGIGAGAAIARIGSSATTQGNTDVASALNLLVGIRAFITPYVAVFTEYKYSQATFEFNHAFGPTSGFNGNYDAHILVTGLSYHY
jgi:opacity protein-like surface antigen